MVEVPGVGRPDAVVQRDRRFPAQVIDPRDVEELPGSAVGLGGIPQDLACIADDGSNQLSKFTDGHVLADSDVDGLRVVVVFEEEQAGSREVIYVEKLTARRPTAPTRDRRGTGGLRLVKATDQRRKDVTGVGVEVVIWPIEVGRHGGDV